MSSQRPGLRQHRGAARGAHGIPDLSPACTHLSSLLAGSTQRGGAGPGGAASPPSGYRAPTRTTWTHQLPSATSLIRPQRWLRSPDRGLSRRARGAGGAHVEGRPLGLTPTRPQPTWLGTPAFTCTVRSETHWPRALETKKSLSILRFLSGNISE